MRWMMAIPVMAAMVETAEAAITLEQLQQQAAITSAALQRYNALNDELSELESQKQAAFNRWQALSQLAAAYYGAGDYQRGDLYQSAAVLEQAEYDRLTALLPDKRAAVESAWQAYLREYERLQAMLAAYRNQ